MHQAQRDGIAYLSAWLREAAWPLWLAHGIDRARGGFFEGLDLHAKICTADYRRLRVAARQTYVFAEAAHSGLPGAAEACKLGLDFIEHHASHPEGGYAWRFDLAHTPLDFTRDLYDHAFVMLALAAARAHAAARDLLQLIDTLFAHPAGGYYESLPPTLPRRQNPHMHLLEAMLAAHAAFGDAVFLERARALVALFTDRLFDHAAGALPEYFDEQLRPIGEPGIFVVEPGHHCEWVWLLDAIQKATTPQPALREIAGRLMTFVDRHGIDPVHGGVVDELGSDGSQLRASARLWPQTERLKAEFLRPDPSPEKQLDAINVLRGFLRDDGLWHERRAPDGTWRTDSAPASSLYHLTAAILTVERLTERPSIKRAAGERP